MVELNILHASCHIFSSSNRGGIVDGQIALSFVIQVIGTKIAMKMLELCLLWVKILFPLFTLGES